MRKHNIVNALGRRYGYRSYLEICTPLTGWTFAEIDRAQFTVCHRLIYHCAPDFDDRSEITFRAERDSSSCLVDPKARYDCIFVDPFHTFRCSYRDMKIALSLLAPRGSIVVHDCSPLTRELAAPGFQVGPWCGDTYAAYIEFVLRRPEVLYCTVDTDYGCGMMRRASEWPGKLPERERRRECARNHDMFEFFDQHRRELLKLVSVREFFAAEDIRQPVLMQLRNWLRLRGKQFG